MYVFSKEKLCARMKRKRIGRESLGSLIGVSSQAVGKWIRGEAKPKREHIERMTDIFDCGPGSFFTKV